MKHLKTLITLFLLVIGASVSLVHGAEPQVPKRIAIRDWKNGNPSGIIGETKFEGTSGQIHSANLILDVNASGGSFTVVGSGQVKYARLTNDCTVRVPVRRAGDSVYVECQTKYNCNYTIGDAEKTVKEKLYKYLATTADAAKGYVEIKAIRDVHFYTITAVQNGFNSVLPVIELNSKGWASFTSLIPGYVLKLQDKAQAYVATSVDPAEGDFGSEHSVTDKAYSYMELTLMKYWPMLLKSHLLILQIMSLLWVVQRMLSLLMRVMLML